MFGLPEQSIEQALADLETGMALRPSHLSWYQLTIEPNTAFHSRPPRLPVDGRVAQMQELGLPLLAAAGFERYEVSAYSQAGRHSRHNLNYWQFGDYLGIGAGAHGKVSDPASGEIIRSRKKKQPAHYLSSSVDRTAERLVVSEDERPFEFLLNALRLRRGFSIDEFEKRTGVTFSSIGKKVEYLSAQDLLDVTNGQITTTERGYRLLNNLLEEFLD